MATIRPLLEYLPGYMQQYTEMRKIMEAEQQDLDGVWDGLQEVWKNQFIEDADEAGVERWEHMVGIIAKGTDTLNDRKFRLITLMAQELPYTITKLNEVLTSLCGADGYSITLVPGSYSITVNLALTNSSNYQDVQDLLAKMMPANMVSTVQLMFHTHQMLESFTHGDLTSFTHDDLKEGAIS